MDHFIWALRSSDAACCSPRLSPFIGLRKLPCDQTSARSLALLARWLDTASGQLVAKLAEYSLGCVEISGEKLDLSAHRSAVVRRRRELSEVLEVRPALNQHCRARSKSPRCATNPPRKAFDVGQSGAIRKLVLEKLLAAVDSLTTGVGPQ